MVSYAAVITNGHIRPLQPFNLLPVEAQGDFDYVKSDERWDDRFVLYRGAWHDTQDAQRISVAPEHLVFGFSVHKDHPLAAWDAIATDSVWSGTAFRYMTDTEAFDRDLLNDRWGYIIVGRYVA